VACATWAARWLCERRRVPQKTAFPARAVGNGSETLLGPRSRAEFRPQVLMSCCPPCFSVTTCCCFGHSRLSAAPAHSPPSQQCAASPLQQHRGLAPAALSPLPPRGANSAARIVITPGLPEVELAAVTRGIAALPAHHHQVNMRF
jgi:hypothetical protein